MRQYLDLLAHVMDRGADRPDRTGTGTRSVFGYQCRYDLNEGFPLLTTKKMYTRAIVHELMWFLMGDTNVEYLNENGVTIWDEWADDKGGLGPIYGAQWRDWRGHRPSTPEEFAATRTACVTYAIDQIKGVVDEIRRNPNSRRLVVSAWNVADLPRMALAPCHCLFQFYVQDKKLSCQLYQRSADAFLGVPFNIASYALLTHMVANVCGLGVGEFVHSFGDLHVYSNHFEQVREQLTRDPHPLPRLVMPKRMCIDSFMFEDVKFEGYVSHPPIKAPIAV